ncbi:MAG: acetylxylan esterase [Armatimonadota bacterium]|nr:MAG: acetylxylan esterase [Armatimonadota bacterium]
MARPEPPSADARLTNVRHLDLRYHFTPYTSKRAWLTRAGDLRQRILVSTGLWPMPEKAPLNAQVFGRIEREGYTVERVYFESVPGFFVTGNLYRPRDGRAKHPGILNPHGHWGTGRLENTDAGSVPGRCINLARQGHVAFSYDMVGYNDSNQVPHSFGGPREELWGVSLMGLQLWNSIRAVDFLCSLPDVDVKRIGCTGASGGGTQTFMLMAVEDRIKVAVPAVMVSAHMQGGCLCENAPGLRVDAYNVEIASLMAPRPLFLVAATGDWTRDNPTVECPDIRSIYALFGAEDRLDCVQFDVGHNYNKDSREAMYAWMGRWLLGIEEQKRLREQPFEVEDRADLLVWSDRKRPASALDAEGLTEYVIERNRKRIAARMPRDRRALSAFRREMGVALRHALMVGEPEREEVLAWSAGGVEAPRFTLQHLILGRRGVGDRIPAALLIPKGARARGPAALVVHDRGRAALVDDAKPSAGALVNALLAEGQRVLTVDCFLTGEAAGERNRDVKHFTTYNRADLAERVQDILTAIACLRSREDVTRVDLIGVGDAGLWCMLAAGLSQGVGAIAADAARFDTSSDEEYVNRLFCPHLRAAGDFFTAAALTAPSPLLIHNTGDAFAADGIRRIYRAAAAPDRLTVRRGCLSASALAAWLAAHAR